MNDLSVIDQECADAIFALQRALALQLKKLQALESPWMDDHHHEAAREVNPEIKVLHDLLAAYLAMVGAEKIRSRIGASK